MIELIYFLLTFIYDALCDLVIFLKFKKREKHPWRSVNYSKVAGNLTIYIEFQFSETRFHIIHLFDF